eukprot:XP_011412665.1 PREDICTED: uncharacterized protein LOC105317653 [Crassostrea gigas]
MNSITLTGLLLCLFAISIAAGEWSFEGSVNFDSESGVSVSFSASFSYRRKRRSVKKQVFNVVIFIVNQKTGSRFRLNPCDYELYDQDDDLTITPKDFEIIFSHMDKTKQVLVEQLFRELDIDNDQKISLTEFEDRRAFVLSKKTCFIDV